MAEVKVKKAAAKKAVKEEKITKKPAAKKTVAAKPVKAAKKATEKPAKATKVTKKVKEVKDGTIQDNHQDTKQATPEAKEVVAEKTAKAGKRSAKGLKEAEEKEAKVEAQHHREETKTEDAAKPKVQQKPARSRLERKSKNFRKVAEQIDADKVYSLAEALGLATKTSPVKFDATVEMHVRLGVDPRQADQNIRDIVVLPAGTGKTVRIAVFADVDGVATAKKAGADVAGSDEFLQQLDKGVIDFDVLIATPAMMAKLGKYARVLGPKGLMPNPKSGTVTTDIAKAVTEAKAGRVEYRVDSTGIVHLGIGKVSFGDKKLLDNAQAVLTSIKANKPGSLKSNYLKSLYITTSMGPSIPVQISDL